MASPLRPGPKGEEILKDFEIIRELRLCVGKTELLWPGFSHEPKLLDNVIGLLTG